MTTAEAPADIGARFLETARRRGAQPALIQGGRRLGFAELAGDVERLARGFRRAGLGLGDRVAVLVPPSADFAAAAFALMRAGAVPVLIDPGIGLSRLKRCLAEAEPVAFVGSPKAHLGRLLGRWAPSARMAVVCGGRFPGAARLDELRALGAREGAALPVSRRTDRAAILFTSGSTGAPKGAVYEHGMFAAQLEQLKALFGVEEGDVAVSTFPLFALFDLALGQTVVLPRMDFTRPGSVDPLEIVMAVSAHGAKQLFGSPALLDRVGRYVERHGIVLPPLERVMSAGAPVPPRALARFAKALRPGVPIHTPYGATEALPVALTDSREILGETAALTARGAGTCVGRPVPGVHAAVIKIVDGPIKAWSEDLRLPPGETGELAVKGPAVTGEYFRRLEDMALAKIGEGEDRWHRMGDLGRFDAQGRLWFCGRKSERVGALLTACVEGVFDALPEVRRSALINLDGVPALCVEREPGSGEPDAALCARLLAMAGAHEASRGVRRVLVHRGFPVDIRHNAKIDRAALARWAKGRS